MKKESKENIQKELLELGSSLTGPSADSGFGVPQDYFEKLPDRVQQRIAANPAPFKMLTLRKLIPAAATFALLVAVVLSFLVMKNGTEQGVFSQMEEGVVDDYFAFVTEYDHSLIYEVTSQDALFDDNQEFIHGSTLTTSPEDDQMIEYMLDMAEYYGLNTSNLIAEQD